MPRPSWNRTPEMGCRINIPKSTYSVDIVIIVEQLLALKAYRQA
jgi:hypothetical protein